MASISDPHAAAGDIVDPSSANMSLTPVQLAMVAGEMSADRWQRDVVQVRCHLAEPIDAPMMQSAAEDLVQRHDSLRARLHWNDRGEGRLSVDPSAKLPVRLHDWIGLTAEATSEARRALDRTCWLEPFDVRRPPRLRLDLIRLADTEHELILTYQETVLDEHAGKLLTLELLELYDARCRRRTAELGRPVPFADYQDWYHRNAHAGNCPFWGGVLADADLTPPPLIDSGTLDHSIDHCVGSLTRALSPKDTQRLTEWAQAHGGTLETALLAAWSLVLAWQSGGDAVRFSVVLSQRTDRYVHADDALAMCFTVLPFLAHRTRDLTAAQLLGAVQQQLHVTRRRSLPCGMSAETRRRFGAPENQSLVFFDEQHIDDFIHRRQSHWQHRRFELLGRNPFAMAMRGFGGERMRLQAWYNPARYGRQVIDCLLDQVAHVLARLPDYDSTIIDRQMLLPPRHAAQLAKWSCGPTAPYKAAPLHHLFEAQVAEQPDAIAATDGEVECTYRGLNRWAEHVARRLRSVGIAPRQRIAIHMDRSLAMLASVLGVLKAGGAYVPIDLSWPPQRIQQALDQIDVAAIITDPAHVDHTTRAVAPLTPTPSVVVIDADPVDEPDGPPPAAGATADDPAYIIFTSGSTGRPKGVEVRHAAVCNLIDWAKQRYQFGPADHALWVTSLGFDLSVFDLFGMLACGGSIRVVGRCDLNEPDRLVALLADGQVTFWNSAPQALEQVRRVIDQRGLPADANTSALRLIFLSGDWIPLTLPGAIRSHFTNANTVALGGATEATVWSNFFEPQLPIEPRWRSIPYGRPIRNARYYVLDDARRPCPIGIPGELYIAGDVLAEGYAGRADLTAERFVADTVHPAAHARMYRTGDAARWWPSGEMELIGRLDAQVKVRGFRIELQEVEHALSRLPQVAAAAAAVRTSAAGDNRLVGIVVAQPNETVSNEVLRAGLARQLPDYMVPGTFIAVESLPMTDSGKLDRRALASLGAHAAMRDRPFSPPTTATQLTLASVFQQVLNLHRVGLADNFFELGGDSLLALEVIFATEQRGLSITIDALRDEDLAGLAASATVAATPAGRGSDGRTTPAGPIPLTPSQRWLLDRRFNNAAAYVFATWLEPRHPLDVEALRRAWRTTVDHHEALRIGFVEHNGQWVQMARPPGGQPFIEAVDLSSASEDSLPDALDAHAGRMVRRMRLDGSALCGLMATTLPNQQAAILLTMAHIITDDFTVRMVVSDLGRAYRAIVNGRSPQLPATSDAFSSWARALHGLGQQMIADDEIDALCRLPWAQATLPLDNPRGINTYGHAHDIHSALSPEASAALVQVARRCRVSVEAMLLTALAQACEEWTGSRCTAVDITANGRQPIDDSLSAHRTAGYLSAIYPMLIDQVGTAACPEAIAKISRQYDDAPGKGVRFGLWRYGHRQRAVRERLANLPRPQIKFNYHGTAGLLGDDSPFSHSRFAAPLTLTPDDERRYLLNLEASLSGETFAAHWKYSRDIHHDRTIRRLADRYLFHLTRCVDALSGLDRAGPLTIDRRPGERPVSRSDGLA